MDSILSIFSHLYLPIAEVSISSLALIAMGIGIGFIAGMCGIGGGVISIPMLISLGVPTQIAVATATNQATAASSSGYLTYARKGKVDYKLAVLLLIGSIIGAAIGTNVFYWLSSIGKIDTFVSVSFLIVLSIVSIISARDVAIIIYYKYRNLIVPNRSIPKFIQNMKFLPTTFISVKQPISAVFPIVIGYIGGLSLALLGIGGGIIVAPIMLSIGIEPSYTRGTVHLQIMVTSIISCIIHATTSYSVDIVLSAALVLGTVLGAQFGARIGAKFSQETFRIVLATVLLVLCIKVGMELFATPNELYSIERVAK